MAKELTYAEVAEHSSKKDLFIVVHDTVYNASSFVDEHPGGEEVLLDVGGQDATEAFEDVGHSDEAREILDGMKIGALKRLPGDPTPKTTSTSSGDGLRVGPKTNGAAVGLYIFALLGVCVAYTAWQFMRAAADRKSRGL
ncbi:MAG: hypothetical protein M1824_003301 [Vezdaea acicularis]|nr:MAG: hypothetical protein M1824_003301 [Vezdaea acicularis]